METDFPYRSSSVLESSSHASTGDKIYDTASPIFFPHD